MHRSIGDECIAYIIAYVDSFILLLELIMLTVLSLLFYALLTYINVLIPLSVLCVVLYACCADIQIETKEF